ncbi:Endothelin-converting enzyme 2 [Dinochytrium kinnereticum]|nr:Endothelin-converting enzyme 2 [Dinochytrium kinnereticum]
MPAARLPTAQRMLPLLLACILCLLANARGDVLDYSTLERRAEEYQPMIAREFPHLLGPTRLLGWMDKKVDPCDDFYRYACGGFQEKYKEVRHADTLELMSQANALLMEQILSQPIDKLAKTDAERRIFRKTLAYYNSCLDSDAIDSRGFEPIIPFAERIVRDCDEGLDLPTMFSNLHRDAVYFFFKTAYTKVENANPKDLRLQFYPAAALNATKETVVKALKHFIDHRVVKEPTENSLDEVAEWIVSVEKMSVALVQALNKQNDKNDGKSMPSQFMNMKEFSKRTDMPWKNYLTNLNLTGIEDIYFWGHEKYWMEAFKALNQFKKKDLKYLLLWRLAGAHFSKLGRKYYNLWSKDIWPTGIKADFDETPDDKSEIFQANCVQEAGIHFNYMTGHLFVRYAFNSTQRAAASSMINTLFDSYKHTLGQLYWMDEPTRAAALKKLSKMIKIIGYPDWIANAETVDKYHNMLEFHEKTYFENAVIGQVFAELYPSIHQRGRALEKETLLFGFPWQLNAFHLTDYVQIQINSGILQRPLFSTLNPDPMNYGSLGVVIGHEITHAFDATGYKLDSDGILQPWWSEQSTKNFVKGSKCFEEQYGNFSVLAFPNGTRLPINGKITVSENIADNGGFDVALRAWRSLPSVNATQNKPLEGFKGLSALQIQGDAHAPNEARIWGVVANSKDFGAAFQCPVGSRYNPPQNKRCHLY